MSQRFQILALDGGGIKGLFSAAVLACVERDLQIDITEYFDLIVGTSTGGIIALGLGLGLRPNQIVDFYARKGPKIFQGLYGVRWLSHWFFRKFPQQTLCSALQSPEVFGDRKLGDSKKPLVITSYNLGEDDIYLFKTPHHERLKRLQSSCLASRAGDECHTDLFSAMPTCRQHSTCRWRAVGQQSNLSRNC